MAESDAVAMLAGRTEEDGAGTAVRATPPGGPQTAGGAHMKFTSDEIQFAEAESTTEATAPEALGARLPGPVMAYTLLQAHFLSRLQRLSDAKNEIDQNHGEDPFMKRLVDRGMLATYRECVDEGVATEARHILKV